ncbi:hypothetical protein PF010_g14572 [Phytophthora fragariae]|uniref:Uncharacterized protein n=1 Tax=Phytophthora fragariae TaxID=53985 RepID=A0A6G0NPQ2_9STRA|nr:hypothetical protein PF010_g14572 [Phytophthora fragariae]KAE9216949.1 hypothetical protein PF004_g14301 [Phytophthora fragariae]
MMRRNALFRPVLTAKTYWTPACATPSTASLDYRMFSSQISSLGGWRLAHSDDTLTRDQIEVGAVNAKTVLWKEVGVEHRTNKMDYNNLFEAAASDPRFSGINPSCIVQHDDGRLFGM